MVAQEFNDIYVVDLGGDVRKNPKLSGTKNNVFGIQTGVAISFMVKTRRDAQPCVSTCQIHYVRRPEIEIATDKLAFLRSTPFKEIDFNRIQPDKNHNWLNLAENDFDNLLLLANKETKLAKSLKDERALFRLFSNGAITARDEWVYDLNIKTLKNKMKFFCEFYSNEQQRWNKDNFVGEPRDFVDRKIKWSDELIAHLTKGTKVKYDKGGVRVSLFRPYFKSFEYVSKVIVHRFGQMDSIFPNRESRNICIAFNFNSTSFACLASNLFFDFALLKFANGNTQCFPFYRYDSEGNRTDNITDWGLNKFCTHYQDNTITKENIFHYTYAVLHHPAYREKYALNLKREFPRLPFYDDFYQWVTWGKQLMDLHLNYETVKKHPLKRIDKQLSANKLNQPKLKADKIAGEILLDAITTLQGVPTEAWDYKLGNRSALEWILDQYKEKKPKDKTIAEQFNTYRFADYKETVIELLQRVCAVSVETMRIIGEMP
ncbi:MAG: hypothetical protein DRR19_28505 [Candidatus Parabeggiatoa sp. nov. 1]|nr:MAG: hypothetical protein DRR19_28505 [Gammaproteobacteria bacterium]